MEGSRCLLAARLSESTTSSCSYKRTSAILWSTCGTMPKPLPSIRANRKRATLSRSLSPGLAALRGQGASIWTVCSGQAESSDSELRQSHQVDDRLDLLPEGVLLCHRAARICPARAKTLTGDVSATHAMLLCARLPGWFPTSSLVASTLLARWISALSDKCPLRSPWS